MIGATFCSGIGAPEVAAPWVDWLLASEIEPFPRAVLQQRFGYRLPFVHNQGEPLLWGDMTGVTPDLLRLRGIPLPNLIVAGTPCQAFSVAGARRGLADKRGNLTLAFVDLCHAIVDARPDGRLAVLWENVPGVLSDKGNAFGCFLGGLVGAVDALRPPADGSWPGEGMVQGPRARAAWCVLDAQWFGVAQRRRRVFVVVDFGNAVDPAAVLLEPDRLRGDRPPRREAGEGAAPTLSARTRGGGGLGTDFDCDGGLIASTGDVAHCLNAGGMGRQDYESETMIAHALRGEWFDASEDGDTDASAQEADTTSILRAMRQDIGEEAFTQWGLGILDSLQSPEVLRSAMHGGGVFWTVCISQGREGVQIAGEKDQGAGGLRTVRSARGVGRSSSRPQSDEQRSKQLGAYLQKLSLAGAQFEAGLLCLRQAAEGLPALLKALSAVQETRRSLSREGQSEHAPWAVRRLTPRETARLQGFPDDHTAITVRGKPAADGPQYKAHGNSMAVPVIRWITDRMRISMEERS